MFNAKPTANIGTMVVHARWLFMLVAPEDMHMLCLHCWHDDTCSLCTDSTTSSCPPRGFGLRMMIHVACAQIAPHPAVHPGGLDLE